MRYVLRESACEKQACTRAAVKRKRRPDLAGTPPCLTRRSFPQNVGNGISQQAKSVAITVRKKSAWIILSVDMWLG
jgi:hypothetical protein